MHKKLDDMLVVRITEDINCNGFIKIGESAFDQGYITPWKAINVLEKLLGIKDEKEWDELEKQQYKIRYPYGYSIFNYNGKVVLVFLAIADKRTGALKDGLVINQDELKKIIENRIFPTGNYYILVATDKINGREYYRLAKLEYDREHYLFIDGKGRKIIDNKLLSKVAMNPAARINLYRYIP